MSRIEGTSPGKAGVNELSVNSEGEATVFAVIEEELEQLRCL